GAGGLLRLSRRERREDAVQVHADRPRRTRHLRADADSGQRERRSIAICQAGAGRAAEEVGRHLMNRAGQAAIVVAAMMAVAMVVRIGAQSGSTTASGTGSAALLQT